MVKFWGVDADPTAQGRIKGARPVAVLDIGSNSVRLVVYERHARALTPLYNEKSACALGRGMAQTGRLAEDNMAKALEAMKRFALVAKMMRVGKTVVLATSAVRDAKNREEFVSLVADIMETPVRVLSGEEEAHFAALGVFAGIPGFSGVVGDLGGGSLELSGISGGTDYNGQSFELGVIRLQDEANGQPLQAAKLVRANLIGSLLPAFPSGGQFAAIGGTWRSLAKLHQAQKDYPLHMVQDYVVRAADMIAFCDDIVAANSLKSYRGSGSVSSSRRELVPFGAAVLSEVLKAGQFESVVFSALGVREGFLYEMLDDCEKSKDPLVQGSGELSVLRSRSPAHADDLIEFTSQYLEAAGLDETPSELRLRKVACLLSDIAWRTHPDYRAAQSVDTIAYGSLTGIDHPGRAFLAQVMAVRYDGAKSKVAAPLVPLGSTDLTTRARLLGALFRVAYPMTAAMPGILPRVRLRVSGKALVLRLPADLAFLGGDHLRNRLRQFADIAGHSDSRIEIDP